jgi:hypothetical protein
MRRQIILGEEDRVAAEHLAGLEVGAVEIAGPDDGAAAQVGQRKVGDAVAAIGRAEQRKVDRI